MTKLINHFALVLDSSGSMQNIRDATINVVNQQLMTLQCGAAAADQETYLSFYTFGGSIKPQFTHASVDRLQLIDRNSYNPEGGTPLFDAVGRAIDDLLHKDVGPHVSFVVVVVTDGEENQSIHYNANRIGEKFKHHIRSDRWTFAFMLPSDHVIRFRQAYPAIPPGNVTGWVATEKGVEDAGRRMSAGSLGYFAGRSQGQTSSKGYFTTDMSKVTTKEVKQLTDIGKKVKIWKVAPSAWSIKLFVENNGMPYVRGCAYYQLTKMETIQPSKQLLIMEKGKKAVYGGHEARDLIGIPRDKNVKVKPGNHEKYDLFVQSLSTTRKLVQDTRVIYYI